jgi:hypothetical protein
MGGNVKAGRGAAVTALQSAASLDQNASLPVARDCSQAVRQGELCDYIVRVCGSGNIHVSFLFL